MKRHIFDDTLRQVQGGPFLHHTLGHFRQWIWIVAVGIVAMLAVFTSSPAETLNPTASPSTSATPNPFANPTPPPSNPSDANMGSSGGLFDITTDTTPVEDTEGFHLGSPLIQERPSNLPEDNEDRFHFDPRDWNQMRRDIEEGREPGDSQRRNVVVSTPTVEAPKPPPGQIRVDLPYESSLSVTGRKVIRVDLKNTHISKERANELGGKQDTQTFEMEQELQARIQGTVARKTTINVNFDDTKENVRDFSVVYKGDPDEVVQEAAFGDITLSLPSTEFVNYDKQLFGIRTALKYKKFGVMAIGSRTKGTTETKRFVGSTTRNLDFINDTAYIRHKYYDLTFEVASASMSAVGVNRDTVISNVVGQRDISEVVYMEDTVSPTAQNYVVSSPTAPADSGVIIRMKILSRGVDYTIDPAKGVITFLTQLPGPTRVAIDFLLVDGTHLISHTAANDTAVLIKDENDLALNVSQEIKRFYQLKSKNIVKDNNLGNFVFKVMDKNRTAEILTSSPTLFRYPDTIEMDFVQGIFKLNANLPFPEVYAQNVSNASALQSVFSIEYQGILRTFALRPNIVLQSESVLVDGRKVNRDLDYFIDYDIGLITFFNDDLVRESTVIEVTYEFAPFGGTLGETLVGVRGTYDILTNQHFAGAKMENWKAGSTVLYNFAAKPTAPPDIRATPASLLVTEGDTQVKGLTFGKIPVKTNLSAEEARSNQDPNLYGKALIDSFEGLKQEDNASMLQDSWLVASNPQFSGFNLIDDFRGRELGDTASHIRWDDGDIATSDPNDQGATQKAMQISYNLNTDNSTIPEQESIVSVLSFAGRDFSKKTMLEVEVQGACPPPLTAGCSAGAGVDLIVDYGTFNENADGDFTTGSNPVANLDTEDRQPFDGTLNLGEDIGWTFNGPGPDLTLGTADDTTIGVGANNARMDTEDLNGDRVLNLKDQPATLSPLFKLSDGHTWVGGAVPVSDLSFSTRVLFQIPLDIKKLTVDEQNNLSAVRQVRVTLRNTSGAGTPHSGTISISKISMVGISWEPATLTSIFSTMTVRGINNKDDGATYRPLVTDGNYKALYKDAAPSGDDFKEQALSMSYDLVPGSTGTTLDKFGGVRDFSKHDSFNFFLYRVNDGGVAGSTGTFFLQAGSEVDYQQISIPISSIISGQWTMYTIKQADTNGDGIPDTWQSTSPEVTVTKVGGAPNLTQIAQMKAGVYNSTNAATNATNEIWINEIHVSGSHERVGHARKYSFDSSWTNWMDFGGTYRDVDRNWQTPTTPITNQDRTEQSAFAYINRLSMMPIRFDTARDVTITPSAFQSNSNALVSVLEEGRVENQHHSATADLLIPKLPQFSFQYKNDTALNTALERKEDTRLMIGKVTYAPTSKIDLLPGKRLTFQPIPSSLSFIYTRKETKVDYSDLDELVGSGISTAPFTSTDITQLSDESEARMSFSFWNGFTFNPTYKLRVDTDKRSFRRDELDNATVGSDLQSLNEKKTPRQIAQNVSASGGLRLLKWFEPRYNYSFSGTETNNLTTLTNTTGYLLKSIDRSSQGELSASIQAIQMMPRTKLLSSMNINASYKVENGDSYADVPKDFSWKSQLWVGTPLNISSGTGNLARRTSATDRRTFQANTSWLPFSGYQIAPGRLRPFSTLSITNNYIVTTEDSETTGTSKRVKSETLPDIIMTINDIEDFFNIDQLMDQSRLTLKDNVRRENVIGISKSKTMNFGSDYQFKFYHKWDVAASYSLSSSRQDNLVSNLLSSQSDTKTYSLQTRIPKGSWAYTPRYQRSETDAHDSVNVTNDLRTNTYSLQIYGDINRPLGIRLGRYELGVANRLILNSTLQWDNRRSAINPSTNYLDIYSATLSGDYTLSKNFRVAIGGNYSQEKHHPDFSKLDQSVFGINSTLTIQF